MLSAAPVLRRLFLASTRLFHHRLQLLLHDHVALGLDSNSSYVLPTVYAAAPSVNRLESNTSYFYADVDLSPRRPYLTPV